MRKHDCPQSAIDNTINSLFKGSGSEDGLLGLAHLIYILACFDIIVSESNLLALTHTLKIIITLL